MSCFDYPIDSRYLLRKKKTIKKQLVEMNSEFLIKKVAILGGSTTNEIADQLELFLLHYGIQPVIYQSAYGKYWEDAIFGNEEINNFNPDVVYIHTSWRNIECFPSVNDTIEEVEEKIKKVFAKYEEMWGALYSKYKCLIIQNNFERPNCRLFGNMDVWDYRGYTRFINRINDLLYTYAANHNGFFVNDIEFIASEYGLSKWSNSLYWNMYKYAFPLDAAPLVASSIARIIKAVYGKNKKALVLDLDNTLWGGVIGDDGIEGIAVGAEIPMGQVYVEFQQYCKSLKNIGVVLAIVSKNDENNALLGLTHPDCILKKDDFVSIKANWEPKDCNIREIAEELNLGLDSFVFVDDNPAERLLVEGNIPGISCVNVDDIEQFITAIDRSGFFEAITISKEDVHKTELYHSKVKILQEAKLFSDYGEYLDSMEMKAIIRPFNDIYIKRIAQLTNKSNQFNLTMLRCSEGEIKNYAMAKNYICLCGRLIDKYADNGIVSVVIGEIKNDILHIRLWLMSCRVLKRSLEDAMMNILVDKAKKVRINRIAGYYYPSTKNSMVKDFYKEMGFSLQNIDSSGNSSWVLEIKDYVKRKIHMIIECEE